MTVLDDCFLCNRLKRSDMTCSIQHPYFKDRIPSLAVCDERSPMTEWCIEDREDFKRIARFDLSVLGDEQISFIFKDDIAEWVAANMPKVFLEHYKDGGDLVSLFFENDAQMLHFKMMWWN